MIPINAENQLIEPLLEELGIFLIQKQSDLNQVVEKGPLDLVTEADFEVERRLKEAIQLKFPGDRILAEENERLDENVPLDGRVWVIDPLDGTVNYAYGSPVFAISIGLFENGQPQLGWVFAPALNELFYAAHNQGAFLNGKRLSDLSEAPAGLISISSGFIKELQNGSSAGVLSWLELGKFRNLGSQALQLCYVAAGRLGLNINWEAKIWDDFAGAVILKESGCVYETYGTSSVESGYSNIFHQPEKALQSVACHPSLQNKTHELLKQTVWKQYEARSY